jgi:hypothetical protein
MAFADLPMPAELALPEGDVPFTDAALEAIFDPDDDEAPELVEVRARADRWSIYRDDEAEWAGRHLAEARAETRRLEEQASEWADRIGHWFEQASKRSHAQEAFFAERLADYGIRRRVEGLPPTLTLPSVEIKTTRTAPAVVVIDDDVVADYLDAQGGSEWADAYEQAWPNDAPEIVRRDPKVYVVPLRKLVSVQEVFEEAWDWMAILDCGHHVQSVDPVPNPDDVGVLSRGDIVDCAECGTPATVKTSVTRQRKRLAAVGPDGVEVPGLAVAPEKITPKVSTR